MRDSDVSVRNVADVDTRLTVLGDGDDLFERVEPGVVGGTGSTFSDA